MSPTRALRVRPPQRVEVRGVPTSPTSMFVTARAARARGPVPVARNSVVVGLERLVAMSQRAPEDAQLVPAASTPSSLGQRMG